MKAAFVFAAILALACLALAVPVKHDYNFSAAMTYLSEEEMAAAKIDAVENNETYAKAALGYPLYKQCGQSWSGQRLGTCGDTVCQSGCAMSSVSMLLAGRGVSSNPGTLNQWLTQNGGYANGCLIIWGAVDRFGKTRYAGQFQSPSESQICSSLNAGKGVIANVRGGGHWVLVTGCRGGGVFNVNDSGFNQGTYTRGEIVRISVYN